VVEPVRLLYVGGVPRSGSTLADLMIGQLPGHVGVGELYYLWTDGPRHNVCCACGAFFADCPFWREVGSKAYGGWPDSLVDEMIAETSGAQVVVDSSKRPSLAFALRRAPGVDLAVAHVVRDPRGVAYSWRKKVPDGATHRGDMPQWSTATVSRRWITVNASIAALRRFGVRSTRVRYEDLVADPVGELTRIAALQGMHVGGLDFLRDGGIWPAATHTIAGSRIRHSKDVLPLRLDEEWRTRLPAAQQRAVTIATSLSRWRYGYR
jgi:hypothetical protein